MPNLPWSQNEVVQAYEEKFLLLEAARKEYEQSVFDLIEALSSALEARRSAISLEEGMTLSIQPRDFPEFACRTLECALKTDEDESRVQIVARMATPWRGKVGQLQLGVVARLDGQLIPWDTKELLNKHKNRFQRPTITPLDATWLWAGEVDLSDADVVNKALDEIEKLRAIAEEIAWEIDGEVRFSKRICDTLESSRYLIEGELISGWEFKEKKLGWWKGIRYLEIKQNGKPSFWVGFHVKNGNLMYGHDERNGLKQTFANAINVVPMPNDYGGYPAGVWKTRQELQTLLNVNDGIRDSVFWLFKKFTQMA